MVLGIRVLGPIEIETGTDGAASLGPRIRRLLAALVMADGGVVSAARLSEAVWYGERPPDGSTTLASTVSRLRRLLDGDATIEHQAGGYALAISDELVDARRFERTVHAVAPPDLSARRLADLEQAIGTWRGAAYEEFAGEPWAHTEALRLEDLRGRRRRGTDGGSTGERSARGGPRRCRPVDHRAPAALATPGGPHDRALSRRPAGGGSADVPGLPVTTGRADRA